MLIMLMESRLNWRLLSEILFFTACITCGTVCAHLLYVNKILLPSPEFIALMQLTLDRVALTQLTLDRIAISCPYEDYYEETFQNFFLTPVFELPEQVISLTCSNNDLYESVSWFLLLWFLHKYNTMSTQILNVICVHFSSFFYGVNISTIYLTSLCTLLPQIKARYFVAIWKAANMSSSSSSKCWLSTHLT
jgi:hypothetical protein